MYADVRFTHQHFVTVEQTVHLNAALFYLSSPDRARTRICPLLLRLPGCQRVWSGCGTLR